MKYNKILKELLNGVKCIVVEQRKLLDYIEAIESGDIIYEEVYGEATENSGMFQPASTTVTKTVKKMHIIAMYFI